MRAYAQVTQMVIVLPSLRGNPVLIPIVQFT